jgi:hypothetical protein
VGSSGLMVGLSSGHLRLKYKLFSPSDEKKITFVYPLSKSKKAGTLNLKTNSADWFKLLARFFWKIAINQTLFYNRFFLGNLPKK